MSETESRFEVVFVLFDGVTQLDFAGPAQVLARVPAARVCVAAERDVPVQTDCGFAILPTHTFETAPVADLLCVPGGFGVEQAVQNAALVSFVKSQAARARYVTSVCTGAFVLGVAGLLRGRRATTHWAYRALLSRVGAIAVDARVVRDGPVCTGGGVTAGVDFGLTLAAEIAGEEHAQRIALALEYDPHPPVESGSPARAPEALVRSLDERYRARREAFEAILHAGDGVATS